MARVKQRGSALIMVMLVVAGITTIVFATQRIALVQFSQSVREEDNLIAGYAAQAGIEDGLARYHFERNVQTEPDKMFRFNLTKATYPDTSNPNYQIDANTNINEGVDGDFDPNYQYYDLAISYKTQRINVNREDGALVFPTDTELSRVDSDSTLTLTGFPNDPGVYYLRFAFKFLCTAPDLNQAFVTLQQVTSPTGGGLETASQEIARPTPGLDTYDSKDTANLLIDNGGISVVSSIRLRAYYCPIQYAFATTRDVSGKGGDDDPNNLGPQFDSLTTEILSTGYFGSAKRTLIAQVDRQSGNLIGIFDYLLYAGGNTGTIKRRP